MVVLRVFKIDLNTAVLKIDIVQDVDQLLLADRLACQPVRRTAVFRFRGDHRQERLRALILFGRFLMVFLIAFFDGGFDYLKVFDCSLHGLILAPL